YLGIFSACSTSMEGLALAAFLVNYTGARYILTGASSHHAAAERQFRYPTKYGGQKPPTAQHTVTGAGFALVGAYEDKEKPHAAIISATIGTVVDHGIRDPFNMGVAMAPAAVATIIQHFKDFQVDPSHYDLIVTGDLAKAGRHMALELLQEEGWNIEPEKFVDCGLMIYSENQQVYAGGSGPGCSATVVYGHLLNEMKKGKYKRILVVATGALLSPLSVQQKETIPCIAHAAVLEWQQ
ncbi:MAG TPA: hypothetical protein VEY51_11080, partial [Chondromyces sp.]|nr:hypothetical protein [Chondromyces sp.]